MPFILVVEAYFGKYTPSDMWWEAQLLATFRTLFQQEGADWDLWAG
jgi:hypothetical protein